MMGYLAAGPTSIRYFNFAPGEFFRSKQWNNARTIVFGDIPAPQAG